jgi:HSP20 family molecular chaperone IbpA
MSLLPILLVGSATAFPIGQARLQRPTRAPAAAMFNRAFAELERDLNETLIYPPALRQPPPAMSTLEALAAARYHDRPRQRESIAIDATGTHYTLTVELPGVPAKEVGLTVADGVLTVAGEGEAMEESGVTYRASYRARLALPADADCDALATTFVHGKVVLTLPRAGAAVAAFAAEASEAASLAAASPRLARWLRANGYLYGDDDDWGI